MDQLASNLWNIVVVLWQWLQNFVSGFRHGLGWPHAILILFLTLLGLYRTELRALIPRIQQIGKDGLLMGPLDPPLKAPGDSMAALPEASLANMESFDESHATKHATKGLLPLPPPLPTDREFPFTHQNMLASYETLKIGRAHV